MQEEQLPWPKTGMRRQLDLWASQAAAIRAGGLQLSCELAEEQGQVIHLSPHGDQVAAHHCSKDRLIAKDRSIVLAPLTGNQEDLQADLSAQPPSTILTVPGCGQLQILASGWSPSGQHLVLVSEKGARICPRSLRISTYRGAQLVGSFLEPLEDGELGAPEVHVLDDAACLLLMLFAGSASNRLVASTPLGVVTARHRAETVRCTAALDAGRILRAAPAGNRLCIFPAFCVQEISLQRDPAPHCKVQVSCWGGTATVLTSSQSWSKDLLFVDVVRQEVQHLARLTMGTCHQLAQGARSVALADRDQISVLTCAGKDLGRELFRCQGGCPVWDALGRFLAVMENLELHPCVSVLDGLTGVPVAAAAVWPAYQRLQQLRWLPDSRGFVVDKDFSID